MGGWVDGSVGRSVGGSAGGWVCGSVGGFVGRWQLCREAGRPLMGAVILGFSAEHSGGWVDWSAGGWVGSWVGGWVG